jgi:2-oxoglutarate ferredoxin oxidoreductase subunit alpha
VGAARQPAKTVESLDTVVIRFAGDSGDGMQITGTQFTIESALAGNDLSTLPDFPAEIRAPAGTLAGVSGFQLSFSSNEVFTPGDVCDVLVAMNPAALKVNLDDLKPNGMLIVDGEQFTDANLKKAEYPANPLADGSLDRFRVFAIDITKLTANTLVDSGLSKKAMLRCKNFFALGLTSWIFHRPIEPTLEWITAKFKKSPELAAANTKTLRAGYNFGETTELFHTSYEVQPARIAPGKYRNITGNTATALGLLAAAHRRAGRSSTAATRSHRRATSCTSSRPTRASASTRSRPRTRSPPRARRSGRRSAGPSASPRPAAPVSASKRKPSASP